VGERLGVVWDERLAEYDFGPGHPLAPVRVQLAMRLAAEFGLFAHHGVQMLGPVEPVDDELILRVHDADYVAAVRLASSDPHFYDAARGLGTTDDPVFPDMHRAACRVSAASLMAAQAVHRGEVDHAVNLAGGLHHAMPGAAEGFCVSQWPSRGCSTRAWSGWPTSTSTCTTATASRRSSGTTPG